MPRRPRPRPPTARTAGRYLLVTARFNEGLLDQAAARAGADGAVGADGRCKKPDEAKKDDAKRPTRAGGTAAAETACQGCRRGRRQGPGRPRENAGVEREEKPAPQAGRNTTTQAKAGAEKRVRELNNRFADWYYVVVDKEYANNRLTRDGDPRRRPRSRARASQGGRLVHASLDIVSTPWPASAAGSTRPSGPCGCSRHSATGRGARISRIFDLHHEPVWIWRPIGAGSLGNLLASVYCDTCSPLSDTANVSPFASRRDPVPLARLEEIGGLRRRAPGYLPL